MKYDTFRYSRWKKKPTTIGSGPTSGIDPIVSATLRNPRSTPRENRLYVSGGTQPGRISLTLPVEYRGKRGSMRVSSSGVQSDGGVHGADSRVPIAVTGRACSRYARSPFHAHSMSTGAPS